MWMELEERVAWRKRVICVASNVSKDSRSVACPYDVHLCVDVCMCVCVTCVCVTCVYGASTSGRGRAWMRAGAH